MGAKTAGNNRKGKPRGIRRDRDCQSCKTRGIKCDLNRPRCQPCVQSGLPCGGYPQRVVWASDTGFGQKRPRENATTPVLSQESTSPADSAKPNAGSSQTTTPVATPLQMHERYMTVNQYSFIKRLAVFYEQIKDANRQSDGRYLSPEAIELVSRIWDFIRARMKGPTATDGSTGRQSMDAVHFHVEALMRLTEAIDKAHPIALFGIATFAFFEVCDGSFGEWQCHLNGARSLLDFHCRNKADLDRLSRELTGLNDIVAHLVWFDTMGAIIRGSNGLIFDDWHREVLGEDFFAGVGCPLDTFHLFVTLAKAGNNMSRLDLSFEALDQLLLRVESNSSDSALVENAWRCTAAIAIISRIGDVGSLSRRKALSTAVDQACRVLAIMPPTSGIYIHLAATAYLAGIHATHPRQCEIVRTYWRNCRASDFPRYPDAQGKCEAKWRAEGLA